MDQNIQHPGSSKERNFWIILLSVLVFTGGLLLYRIFVMQASLRELRRQEQVLTAQLDSLKTILSPVGKSVQGQTELPDFEKDELQHPGLPDPRQDLIKDLLQHPELIPEPPVAGGTMAFSADEAFVLTDKWLFTSFSDGHVKGYILLEYEISPRGAISWTVIKSYLLE